MLKKNDLKNSNPMVMHETDDYWSNALHHISRKQFTISHFLGFPYFGWALGYIVKGDAMGI